MFSARGQKGQKHWLQFIDDCWFLLDSSGSQTVAHGPPGVLECVPKGLRKVMKKKIIEKRLPVLPHKTSDAECIWGTRGPKAWEPLLCSLPASYYVPNEHNAWEVCARR